VAVKIGHHISDLVPKSNSLNAAAMTVAIITASQVADHADLVVPAAIHVVPTTPADPAAIHVDQPAIHAAPTAMMTAAMIVVQNVRYHNGASGSRVV